MLNVSGNFSPMTKERAKAHADFYNDGILPPGTPANKDHYKAGHADVLKANIVVAKRVNSSDDLAPWARNASSIYVPDHDGQLWDLDCSRSEYSHSNNICPGCDRLRSTRSGITCKADVKGGGKKLCVSCVCPCASCT